MIEGLFILTVIFAAYVVYQVMNDKKRAAQTTVAEAKPASAAEPAAAPPAVKEEASPAPVSTPAKPAATEAASASPAPAAAPKAGLRNPETGEVATAFTNYRFAKRWIKEALVSEGLLDKVYKNNELDANTEAKIKDAVTKLEAMPKYQP